MEHWANKYVGKPYISKQYDCASLAVDVLREVFGKDVPDYGERPASRSEGHADLAQRLEDRTTRIEKPVEGCAVQILVGQRIAHVGVYCEVDGWPCVLHNIRRHGVILTKLQDMRRHGWIVEGFYEWK